MSTAATETKKGIGKAGMLDAATMDELKQLGWRVEKLESGWSAHEVAGDRKIGPAASLAALKTQVGLASGPVANGKGKAAGGGVMVKRSISAARRSKAANSNHPISAFPRWRRWRSTH